MSVVYGCCGRERKWGWNNHADHCYRAAAMRRHPSSGPAPTLRLVPDDRCPQHPSEGRIDCRPCEQLSDERRGA